MLRLSPLGRPRSGRILFLQSEGGRGRGAEAITDTVQLIDLNTRSVETSP